MQALKSDLETKISSVKVNLSKKIDGIGGKEEVDFLKAESTSRRVHDVDQTCILYCSDFESTFSTFVSNLSIQVACF
jgi:hypothetical protein